MVWYSAGQRRRKCCSLRGVSTARDGTQAVPVGGMGGTGEEPQAGYPLQTESASRIAALQAEAALPSSEQSLQAITRQELAELLAKVIKAGFGNPERARINDALKASELLTKLCGWNEPERALHSTNTFMLMQA